MIRRLLLLSAFSVVACGPSDLSTDSAGSALEQHLRTEVLWTRASELPDVTVEPFAVLIISDNERELSARVLIQDPRQELQPRAIVTAMFHRTTDGWILSGYGPGLSELVVELVYYGLTRFYSPLLSDLIRVGEELAEGVRVIERGTGDPGWSEGLTKFVIEELDPPLSDSVVWGYASGALNLEMGLLWMEHRGQGSTLRCEYHLYGTVSWPGFDSCRGGRLPLLRTRDQTGRIILEEIVAGGGIWRGW